MILIGWGAGAEYPPWPPWPPWPWPPWLFCNITLTTLTGACCGAEYPPPYPCELPLSWMTWEKYMRLFQLNTDSLTASRCFKSFLSLFFNRVCNYSVSLPWWFWLVEELVPSNRHDHRDRHDHHDLHDRSELKIRYNYFWIFDFDEFFYQIHTWTLITLTMASSAGGPYDCCGGPYCGAGAGGGP